MHQPSGQGSQASGRYQREAISRPSLRTINVIFATLSRDVGFSSSIMSTALKPGLEEQVWEPKKVKTAVLPILGFSDEDTIGTFQPYDDVLVVTLRIGGYDVKRVLVDQGSRVEIMYPDLYKGLNLKPEDLSKYDSPLVGFDGIAVVSLGMIKLLVQARNEVVKVEFIVVETYFLYMAILVRPWLHTMGAVSSTLYMKVKYPTEGKVREIIGSQMMARQFLVAADDAENQ